MEDEEIEVVEVSLFDDNGQPVDIDQAVAAAPSKEAAPAAKASEFVMPDKFKDKSLEEVVTSYVNLEKEYGNKTNEVGQLRKLTDQILLNQTQQPAQPQQVVEESGDDDVGFDDLINDPSGAVNKALAQNPTIQRMEQTMQQQAQEASRTALLAKHPDADEVVQTPEFATWVQENPARMKMLQEAHVNSDVDMGIELLDTYKNTRVATNEEAVMERDAQAAADLKKATVETGNASPGGTKKPVFRRSELIELKLRDPRKYESMRDVIVEAYADKRVI